MRKQITYKTSGVDVDKANHFVNAIKGYVASTQNASVLKRKRSFGALFALNPKGYKNPVLVSSTDGVGTKLLLAKLLIPIFIICCGTIKIIWTQIPYYGISPTLHHVIF